MHLRHLLLAAALVAPLSPSVALAQARLNVRAQALQPALIEFALQAGVSIDADAARGCGPTRGVSGALSTEAGLRRLLAGTGCDYRMVDPRSVLIVRAPRAAPRPAAPPAAPAPVAQPGVTQVEAVTVTSPKRTLGLARAPYALTAVDGEALTAGGGADASDLTSEVAGLTMTNLGPGLNKLFVRGLADGALTGRTQSVVGIYLDDTRIIYNAPDPDLRLVDIDRVEVLRGPQGSLYGAGSIGGILQIVTQAPQLNVLSGSLAVEGAATKGGAPSNAVEAVINAPLLKDHLAARIVGYREETGGYIDDPAQGLTDAGLSIRQGLRAALEAWLNDDWRARVTYIDQTIRGDDSQYAETETGPYARELAIAEPHRNDFDGLSAVLEGALPIGRLKIASGYQSHEIETRYDATLSLPAFGQPTTAGPAAFDEANDIKAFVTEATLTSRADRRLTWLGGLFISEYDQAYQAGLAAAGPALYAEAREDHIDEYALYGEATFNMTDRLRLTGGGRYYRLGVETDSVVDQAAQSRSFAGRAKDFGFAPKALVEYDLTNAILLYAQAARGYRVGGFNTAGLIGQTFAVPGAGPQPYQSFGADALQSYEAGARLSLLHDALRIRLAVFHASWSDIQTDRLLPSGLPFTANIGDGQNSGLEVEATWTAGPLTVGANLFLNDPELARPDPGFPIPVDRHLTGVPSALFNAQADYRWTLNGGWSAWLGADLGYVGKSTLTFDAGLAPQMGGYVTSQIEGGLAQGPWRLSARLDNVLGQEGDTFAFGNPFRLRERDENTPQRPRTLSVRLMRGF